MRTQIKYLFGLMKSKRVASVLCVGLLVAASIILVILYNVRWAVKHPWFLQALYWSNHWAILIGFALACVSAGLIWCWLYRRSWPVLWIVAFMAVGGMLFYQGIPKYMDLSTKDFRFAVVGFVKVPDDTDSNHAKSVYEDFREQVKFELDKRGIQPKVLNDGDPFQWKKDLAGDEMDSVARALSRIHRAHAIACLIVSIDEKGTPVLKAVVSPGADYKRWPHSRLTIRRSQYAEPTKLTFPSQEKQESSENEAEAIAIFAKAWADVHADKVEDAIKGLKDLERYEALFFRALYLREKAESSAASAEKELERAIKEYDKILQDNPEWPQNGKYSLPQLAKLNRATTLKEQALFSKMETASRTLEKAEELFRDSLDAWKDEDQRKERKGQLYNNLGIVLIRRAQIEEGSERHNRLRDALKQFKAALEIRTKDKYPDEWAATQSNRGMALMSLATSNTYKRTGVRDDNPVNLLEEAEKAYESALEVRTEEKSSHLWAATTNNLGNVLVELGKRTKDDDALEALKDARERFNDILRVRKPEVSPQHFATTSNNLGIALLELGKRSDWKEANELFKEAEKVLRKALKKRNPGFFKAVTQMNLGNVLLQRTQFETGNDHTQLIKQAQSYYGEAGGFFQKNSLSHYWAEIMDNVGVALLRLEKSGKSNGKTLRDLAKILEKQHRSPSADCKSALMEPNLVKEIKRFQSKYAAKLKKNSLNEALTLFLMAQEFCESETPLMQRVEFLMHLGQTLQEMGEPSGGSTRDQAFELTKKLYVKLQKTAAEENLPQHQAEILTNHAHILVQSAKNKLGDQMKKELEHAEKLLVQALDSVSHESLPQIWLQAKVELANVYRIRSSKETGTAAGKSFKKAKDAYVEVLVKHKSCSNTSEQSDDMEVTTCAKIILEYANALRERAYRDAPNDRRETLKDAKNQFKKLHKMKRQLDKKLAARVANSEGILYKTEGYFSRWGCNKNSYSKATEAFSKALEYREKEKDSDEWASTATNFANLYILMGKCRLSGKKRKGLCKKMDRGPECFYFDLAKSYLGNVLTVHQDNNPQKKADANNNLGNLYYERAMTCDCKDAKTYLDEAEKAYKKALKTREGPGKEAGSTKSKSETAPESKFEKKWAESARDLSATLLAKARYENHLEAMRHLTTARDNCEKITNNKTFNSEKDPRDWSEVQLLHALILKNIGMLQRGAKGISTLKKAEDKINELIKNNKRSHYLSDEESAVVEFARSNITMETGRLKGGRKGTELLEESLKKYKNLLKEVPGSAPKRIRERLQHNLNLAKILLGSGPDNIGDKESSYLEQVVKKYRGNRGSKQEPVTNSHIKYNRQKAVEMYNVGIAFRKRAMKRPESNREDLGKALSIFKNLLNEDNKICFSKNVQNDLNANVKQIDSVIGRNTGKEQSKNYQ